MIFWDRMNFVLSGDRVLSRDFRWSAIVSPNPIIPPSHCPLLKVAVRFVKRPSYEIVKEAVNIQVGSQGIGA